MLKDENLVTHNHSHQRDESEDRGESECAVHQSETYQRTGCHQSQGHHTDDGDAVSLEVEQQEEEHDDLRNGNTAKDLRQCLVTVFYLAAHLSTHTLRQLYILLHHTGNFFFNRSGINTLCKLGRHRDTALATAMHDTALAPFGTNFGYLS